MNTTVPGLPVLICSFTFIIIFKLSLIFLHEHFLYVRGQPQAMCKDLTEKVVLCKWVEMHDVQPFRKAVDR